MKKIVLIMCLIAASFMKMTAVEPSPTSKIGILWTSWSVDHFLLPNVYIDKLQSWGIDYISLNPTYFINTYEDGITDTWLGLPVTPSATLQKEIVKELIKRKFYINYRPHVDPIKFAMPMGDIRTNWNTVPGGQDWRGLFDGLNPTSDVIGYRTRLILPGLKMLAEAIREAGAPVTPIRFDLGAELMNSTLNYTQEWIDLRNEVQGLLNTTYSDVKQYIVIGHNFCHHFEYLLRVEGHPEYLTRIVPDQQIDESLLFVDRKGVTQETRMKLGRYIAGLDEMSISQYMPLDIFTKGTKTTSDEVYDALHYHEDVFIKEILIKELGIAENELPVLHIGEYGMGWRGLAAPNVWDRASWIKAGSSHMILNDAQQKEDAAIAIEGIIKYVQEQSHTNYRSFLLWFGGAPYDLLNINAHSAWFNPVAADLLEQYWATHAGVPPITSPVVNIELMANAGLDIEVDDADLNNYEDVTLDASLSVVSGAQITTYKWLKNGFEIAQGERPTVRFKLGTHAVVLVIEDSRGIQKKDLINITITSKANKPPVANAGKDLTAIDFDNNGLESFNLDGSLSSDEDGTIVSYTWSLNAAVIATTSKPTLKLPIGSNKVVLTVVDNLGAEATDELIITVNAFGITSSVIDNFETYATNLAMQTVWVRNTGGGNITTSINTAKATQAASCMKVDYTFSDYAGVQSQQQTLSWTNFDGIAFDLTADNSGRDLLIQIREAGGEFWEAKTTLTDTTTKEVFLPFSSFKKASWQSEGNGVLDLISITEVSIYLGGTAGSGTFYIDNLRAVIKQDNQSPIAQAGNDQTVGLLPGQSTASVLLDATGSVDHDGQIKTYTWSLLGGGDIATGSKPMVSLGLGKHIVYLTVTDNKDAVHTDYVTITVTGNTPTSVSPVIVSEGSFYPNPVQKVLYINLGAEQLDHVNLSLYGIDGNLVYDVSYANNASQLLNIPIESLHIKNGSYVCVVTTASKTFRKVIIVNK